MLKLLCPNCLKTVSVPDAAAGTDTPCPECGKPFPVPARYHPAVAAPPVALPPPPPPVQPEPAPMSTAPTDRPPAPPGMVPPVYGPASTQMEPPLPPPPPPPPIPAGYTHSRGVSISPPVMAWLPAVCLTAIFFLTFFDWVGSYVGGYPVYSQNAWRTITGGLNPNHQMEAALKKEAVWPSDVLNKVRPDWGLMLPYVLALILAIVFVWAERMIATLDRAKLPRSMGWVATVWPYRIPVAAGLATTAVLLLLIQTASGFGLERAMQQAVSEEFAARREAAAGNAAELSRLTFQENQKLASFNLERTGWLHLVVLLHFVVVVAMVVRAWLERRGNRPPPRIVFQY